MWFKPFPAKIFLILSILLNVSCAGQNDIRSGAVETLIIYSGGEEHTFLVELADDDEERRVGLMYRTTLADNAGMLFDFGDPQPISMWMKNTLIPLDMAFIDEAGVIKRIVANTTPRSLESISSGAAVIAVLEVNGGVFERIGVKEGDIVGHRIFTGR